MDTCAYSGYTLGVCRREVGNKRSRRCSVHDIVAKIESERIRDHICIYNPTGRLSDFKCNRIPFGDCKICSRCREYHNVRIDKEDNQRRNNQRNRSRSRSPASRRQENPQTSKIINVVEEQAAPNSVTQWGKVLEMEKFYVAEMTKCKQRLIDINAWKQQQLSELISDAPTEQINN